MPATKPKVANPALTEILTNYEERYRSLFDLSLEAIFIYDLKGNFLDANDYALKMVGYGKEEIKKINFTTILDKSELLKAFKATKDLFADKPTKELLEFKLKKKDGTFVWCEVNSSPLRKDGKIYAIQGIGRNITEKKVAEEKLRKSEERYRELFNSMLSGFALHEIICDKAGKPIDYRFIEVNPAFEKMTGKKAKEVVGKTVLEVFPETEKYWIETYGQVALTQKSTRFEHFSKAVNKFFEVLAFSPIKNEFAAIFVDITDKKKNESKLSEAVQEDRRMLDVMTGRELKMIQLKSRIEQLEKKIVELGGKIPE